jgi:hypothetical protein
MTTTQMQQRIAELERKLTETEKERNNAQINFAEEHYLTKRYVGQ